MAHQEKWGPTALQVILDPNDNDPWICSADIRFRLLINKMQAGDNLLVLEYYGDQPTLVDWTSDGFIHSLALDSFQPTKYMIPVADPKCIIQDFSKISITFIYANAILSAKYHIEPGPV